ncbi:MAG: TonB-dependent receptor [Pseudomonadota bacterium]
MLNTKRSRLYFALFTALASVQQPLAAENDVVLPRVDVIGETEKLPDLAGAATVLDNRALEQSRVFTVNEALRKVPGVHARDEEGFGLRPNIGMRGLNPTRSTKITLLEDGIPLAYAPYGDNASYYHPMVDRYERIEVLKGSGSLLFGPQTVGGVINYITPTPPQEVGGYVQGAVGNRDYFNGKLSLGGKGALFDYARKQGQGARDNMEHALDDLNLKYVTAFGDNQAVTLRANYYQEDSTITYSGLTQAEYDNLGADYNPFKNDKFEADRIGLSATHEYDFGGGALLLTNLYYSQFNRDWWRQASTSTDTQCGAGFVAARLAGAVVDPDSCNSVQGRLRSYYTWGVEPRLTLPHALGEFQAGVKAHFEEQDRKQVNGAAPTARTGTTVENNLRETTAYSAFVANRFDVGQVSITPILRYENIDADRTDRLTGAKGSSSISETMPGLGATWNPSATLTVFSSLHKGFAPPRVEDLIGGAGTVTDVDPEESTNFEFGVRHQPTPWASLQAAYFRSDYQNLIAVGSIAGGSTPLSEGEALFEGVELSALAERDSGLFGRLAYTWLPTAEQEQPFRNVASGAVVSGSAAGNRQPYAPEHTLTAALGYGVGPWRGEIEAQYVGEQFSDFANTAAASANGQTGIIDAYTVWNATLNYRLQPKGATAFLSVKNLADETYIVDRTRGIQIGMPRLVHVGLKYDF